MKKKLFIILITSAIFLTACNNSEDISSGVSSSIPEISEISSASEETSPPEISSSSSSEISMPETSSEEIDETPPSALQKRLPIVNIRLKTGVDIDDIDRYETTEIMFSIDCKNAPEYQSLGERRATIRGRGNSTWTWDKKPYKIKLDDKAPVLGLAANKDWILLANYADKSLMRDTVAYDMARVLDNLDWCPTQIPVELYINNEYRGVYSIGEHMEVAKSRVNLNFEENVEDTDYLLEVGGVDNGIDVSGRDFFHTASKTVRFIKFKEPEGADMTEAQRQFVKDYFDLADAAVLAGEGYEEYIDMDSFCDWLILHELTNNTDSMFRRSCYITKRKGEKLKMGPVWDFDLAFGNYVIDDQTYSSWACIGSFDEKAWLRHNWCNYLMEDEAFRARLRARWNEVKDDLMSAAFSSIDRNYALINPSQEENFELWDIWGVKVGYSSWNNNAAVTYDEQTAYLKNFLRNRYAWIDENI